MSQFRISPDLMIQRAGEYRTESENVEAVISKLDTLINQLENEWDGQSSAAFIEQFTELRPSFVEAKELILNISDILNKFASKAAELDQSITR